MQGDAALLADPPATNHPRADEKTVAQGFFAVELIKGEIARNPQEMRDVRQETRVSEGAVTGLTYEIRPYTIEMISPDQASGAAADSLPTSGSSAT